MRIDHEDLEPVRPWWEDVPQYAYDLIVQGRLVVMGFVVFALNYVDNGEKVGPYRAKNGLPPGFVWAVCTLLVLYVGLGVWRKAATRGERVAETATTTLALVSDERNALQAAVDERNQFSIDLEPDGIEGFEPGPHFASLLVRVVNNGPDGDFDAIVTDVHGLPTYIVPIRNYHMMWMGTDADVVRVYGDGNRRVLRVGLWSSDRDEMRLSFAKHGSGQADSEPFSPPGTIRVDLELRDVGRQQGEKFWIYVAFDDPESGLLTGLRVARVADAVMPS